MNRTRLPLICFALIAALDAGGASAADAEPDSTATPPELPPIPTAAAPT